MGTEAIAVVDRGWRSDRADSREFLLRCLDLAQIEDDIIEDIADACEVAGYTPASLASEDVVVETVAERVFLTEQEAARLVDVCRVELPKGATVGGGRDARTGAISPLAQDWDVLGDGLQGFDAGKAGIKTSPAKAVPGGAGGDPQGAARPNQTVIRGGGCMAARFFPINRFFESKAPPFESSQRKFGKPSAGMSGGFKPFEAKAPIGDGGKAFPVRPAAISAKLQSWTAAPPPAGKAAGGRLEAKDARRIGHSDGGLKSFKPPAPARDDTDSEEDDVGDACNEEARHVYTFKSQGLLVPGAAGPKTSPFWKAAAKPAGFFSLPTDGGAAASPSPHPSGSDSDEVCSAGLPAAGRLPPPRATGGPAKFTQGSSFRSKPAQRAAASRRAGAPGAHGVRPRVPRLKLPQFGTPVKTGAGKYPGSSDESVDTVVTEGSARSQSTVSSWQEPAEVAHARGASQPKGLIYPWGEGGVEPCVRGATWSPGQAVGARCAKKSGPKLKRTSSNDSKRSSDSTCTWRTSSSGTPTLTRQGSGSSQGSSVVGGALPRHSKSSSSFMLPTTASKARADVKDGPSPGTQSKTVTKEGSRRVSRARGSRPFKPQQHRRAVSASATSQSVTAPKAPSLSKESRAARSGSQSKHRLYGGDMPHLRSAQQIECLATGAWK